MKLKLLLSLTVICSANYIVATETTTASAKTEQKPTVKSIVDENFKQGATALIAALKKAGHFTDAQAIEAVQIMAKNNKSELLKKARSGSLINTFSKDLQEAIATKLTGTDLSKLNTLAGLLNK